ncbi:uncharacterized protein LOC133189404 [Saccostrea echinata]|uniref:uncharacterized protein LOC133189404 n=1 Tax=Saccostrea echinata TaxID=191078 RepID=UPI002A816024|nr:uncharacterized protein LOC133189404 [Saccostrea echinata]
MSQPRKRRRVTEGFKEEVKDMLKEMVAEAIPTIASKVVAQLQELNNPSNSLSQSASSSEQRCAAASVQQPLPGNDTANKSQQTSTGSVDQTSHSMPEKFPSQSPCLMKYMATIQKLSNDVGEKAAFFYDEQFRSWRAENPAQMPWDKINAELHLEALQVGLKSRLDMNEKTNKQKSQSQQPFRGKSKKPCFSYNNNNGNCVRPNCEYAHICSRCFGEHPKKECSMFSEPNKKIIANSSKHQNPASQPRK